MAVHFEKSAHTKALIKKAMIYPCVLIATIIGVIIIMLVTAIVSRVKHNYPIRRLNICCNRVRNDEYRQFSLFEDPLDSEEHRRLRLALLGVRRRYGKNAVLRGADYRPAATARERNAQIGGHKR